MIILQAFLYSFLALVICLVSWMALSRVSAAGALLTGGVAPLVGGYRKWIALSFGALLLLLLTWVFLPTAWIWPVCGLLIIALGVFIQKGWKPAAILILTAILLFVVIPRVTWDDYLPGWAWFPSKPLTTAECPGKQMLLALSEELEDVTNGGKCSLVAQIDNTEEVRYSVDKVHEYKPNGWATPDPIWVRGTRKGLLIQVSLCPPRVEKRNFDCTPKK